MQAGRNMRHFGDLALQVDAAAAMDVLLIAGAGGQSHSAKVLRSCGMRIQPVATSYDAFTLLQDDPALAAMVVMECGDGLQLQAGRRLWADLRDAGWGKAVILVDADCRAQSFSSRSEGPSVLRGPLSPLALRLACDACFPAYRVMP